MIMNGVPDINHFIVAVQQETLELLPGGEMVDFICPVVHIDILYRDIDLVTPE